MITLGHGTAGATFSEDQVYRYGLWRTWHSSLGTCLFIMLNPSTADETHSDPTVTRCIGFARDWGFGRVEVVNLFGLRSTDPRHLYTHMDPEGPENRRSILASARGARCVVAAWGVHGAFRKQGEEVTKMLARDEHVVHHLGLTKDGHPKHPLYLPKNSERQVFRLDGVVS